MSLNVFDGSSLPSFTAGDAVALSREFNVVVRSLVELEHLAPRLYNPKSTKLEAMVKDVLNEKLPKKTAVTGENWEESNWARSSWVDVLTDERMTCE